MLLATSPPLSDPAASRSRSRTLRRLLPVAGALALALPAPLRGQSPEDFTFKILDAAFYDGETVTTHVHFDNRAACPVEGWQFGITYPRDLLELVDARCGDTVDHARGGGPAEFCAVEIHGDQGVTVGVVIDFRQQFSLERGDAYDVLALSFRARPGACPFTGTVEFTDTLGEIPIDATVSCEGRAVRPGELQGGTITCRTNPPCGQALFPETEGFDFLETSTDDFRFSLYGQGTFNLAPGTRLQGPTLVGRSGRQEDASGPFVTTQLLDLDLLGTLANGWRVRVTESGLLPGEDEPFPSRGTIRPRPDRLDPAYDYPAFSEFRLFFKVHLWTDAEDDPDSDPPDLVLFNKEPKAQRNIICTIPPLKQRYPYEPPEPVNFYDLSHPDDPPVGQLLGAHNPDLEVPDPPPIFIRGDCNTDGRIDISDAVTVFRSLFLGARVTCLAACDVDATACEGAGQGNPIKLTDGVYLLLALFRGGPPPADPYPFCGPDPCRGVLDLGCSEYPRDKCLTGAAE